MGLSLTSAMIGLVLVIIGVTFRITRKQRKFAMVLLIVGIVLIVVPYTDIYLISLTE
jgi:hypothetical protein